MSRPLTGTRIAITRPVGTAGALARRVRAMDGTPILLPGASLRAAADVGAARAALKTALTCDVAIFSSPAAVRFAQRLGPLHGHAYLLAPGMGTLRALHHYGCVDAHAPPREDSEGLLALPILHDVRGKRVAIIGAAGGRGLLPRELAARGARVMHAQVYQRLPARLDRRHAQALQRNARRPLYVLLSSTEALGNILANLPNDACHALLAGTAVASSERLVENARRAGFSRVLRAASAHAGAMLDAVADDRA